MGQAIHTYRSRLEQILVEEGRKQSWLVEKTGIDRTRLSFVVRGAHCEEDERARIAETLGRNVEDVFGPILEPAA